MLDLLLAPLAAGMLLALAAGPLGAVLVWRRMAFFGDTLSHGTLLGVALGAALHLAPALTVLLTCVALATGLFVLSRERDLGSDTLLGVLAHTALAFGIIAVALVDGIRADLLRWLFGDLLAVTAQDALFIGAGALLVTGALAMMWRSVLSTTIDEDLARVEGVPTGAVKFALALLLALIVALAMKVVGLLLVTALLIVPAAAARRFARDPEAMAMIAAMIGVGSVAGGLAVSWWLDIPAGPAIVTTAAGTFIASRACPQRS